MYLQFLWIVSFILSRIFFRLLASLEPHFLSFGDRLPFSYYLCLNSAFLSRYLLISELIYWIRVCYCAVADKKKYDRVSRRTGRNMLLIALGISSPIGTIFIKTKKPSLCKCVLRMNIRYWYITNVAYGCFPFISHYVLLTIFDQALISLELNRLTIFFLH